MDELDGAHPLLVISPHLDDAVLSCAQLINSHPGSTILTVLAGYVSGLHSGWSAQTTGLPIARDANLIRRQEDLAASTLLGAQSVWEDVLAQEYGPGDEPHTRILAIREAITAAVEATTPPETIVIPLGLTHPDHILVSDVALQAVLASRRTAYVYMEMPYGQARPFHARRRLRHVGRRFVVGPRVSFVGDAQKKAESVAAYLSQIGALRDGFGNRFTKVFTDPERYWHIRPRDAS